MYRRLTLREQSEIPTKVTIKTLRRLPRRVGALMLIRYRRLALTLQSQTSLRLRLCLIHTTLGGSAPVASP